MIRHKRYKKLQIDKLKHSEVGNVELVLYTKEACRCIYVCV